MKLILDANAHGLPKSKIEVARAAGVEIKLFNPFRFPSINSFTRRMHNKLLIVDGHTLLMGGRNVADGYFEQGEHNYEDRDVVISGAAAAVAQDYFRRLWVAEHVKEKRYRVSQRKLGDAQEELQVAGEGLYDSEAQYLGHDYANVRVFFDEVELNPRKESTPVYDAFAQMIRDSQESIVMETGYIVMTRDLFELLRAAVARGVKVKILTNSLFSSTTIAAFAGYAGWRKRMVRAGIELHEYVGQHEIHTKTYIFDRRFAVVSSFNLDPLSRNRNTEALAVVEDEAVAEDLALSVETNLRQARRVTEEGHQEGTGQSTPGVSFFKRLKTDLIRTFLLPFFKKFF